MVYADTMRWEVDDVDPLIKEMKNTIEKLISQTNDMQFMAAFNTTFEAEQFLKGIKIDVVFFRLMYSEQK